MVTLIEASFPFFLKFFMFFTPFSTFPILRFFVFLEKGVFSFFPLFICRFWPLHLDSTKDVSSVVGAPWRCGVLTTLGGMAGIGQGHLLGERA